jgi:hypothetical protein
MRNVEYKLEGKKLTITIPDVTVDLGPSSGGKTHLVASSGGNQEIAGFPGLKVGVNAFRPKPAAK